MHICALTHMHVCSYVHISLCQKQPPPPTPPHPALLCRHKRILSSAYPTVVTPKNTILP